MSCERCGGTGFVIVEREGREYAERCACRAEASVGLGGDASLKSLRIPPRYEQYSLANFFPRSPRHKLALEKVMNYCVGYPHRGKEEEGLGLLFTGSNGVGKTHLAVAVLRELGSGKGVHGQFWDFNELMREIKRSYDPETRTTEMQVLDPVVEVELLVLDDLGAWKITDWMNDTLFYVLNSRYLARRPTLITTNFQDVNSKEALRADPHVRREYLVDRIGQRLRSRITEMCLRVELDGDDFREHRQEGNRKLVLGSSASPEEPMPAPPEKRPLFGG